MTLQLVHAREVACFPWDLRCLATEPVRPAFCRPCGREVALPLAREAERPVCVYCGLDSGLVLPIDIDIGDPILERAP